MKPNAVDAILATNPRYAGASFHKPETEGAFIPMPNTGMVRVQQDAKLNAAKAIVAERLSAMLEIYLNSATPLYYTNEDTRKSLLETLSAPERENLAEAQAALTAWRELIAS